MCIYFRKSNKVTINNTYPIPSSNDFIGKRDGASHLSKIELTFDYDHLRVRDNDILKTNFTTQYSHCGFEVMSFGLTNV